MAIDLYMFLPSPPSRAVLITVKHLDIEVNIKSINLFKGEQKSPEFLKIWPGGQLPGLVDNGFMLTESRAIMCYLANKYAPQNSIYPSDAQARARVDRYLYYDAASMYAAQIAAMLPLMRDKTQPSAELETNLKEKLQLAETLLGDEKFLGGDIATLADISLAVSFPILKRWFANDWTTPKLDGWYERVCAALPTVMEINEQVDLKEFFVKIGKE